MRTLCPRRQSLLQPGLGSALSEPHVAKTWRLKRPFTPGRNPFRHDGVNGLAEESSEGDSARSFMEPSIHGRSCPQSPVSQRSLHQIFIVFRRFHHTSLWVLPARNSVSRRGSLAASQQNIARGCARIKVSVAAISVGEVDSDRLWCATRPVPQQIIQRPEWPCRRIQSRVD